MQHDISAALCPPTALSTAILTVCPASCKSLATKRFPFTPGYAWFYNRQNVYPDLGFAASYFLEDSFDLATQGYGGYVNETATMDKIIETLDTHIKETDTPLFSFTVTIQNHGPYEKKYGTLEQNFSSDIELNETQTDLLTQYFQGIGDADEQIGRLKEYAEDSDEPIVLVYFGDHLPGFSNGMEFFDLLDYPIDANGLAGGTACRLRNTLPHLAKRKRKSTRKYKNGSGNRPAGGRTHQLAVPRLCCAGVILVRL